MTDLELFIENFGYGSPLLEYHCNRLGLAIPVIPDVPVVSRISAAALYRKECSFIANKYKMDNNILLSIDHIVPVSFCRKLGLTTQQASMRENLTALDIDLNIKKWSFVDESVLGHLQFMTVLWGIPFPSEDIINGHNSSSLRSYSQFRKRYYK